MAMQEKHGGQTQRQELWLSLLLVIWGSARIPATIGFDRLSCMKKKMTSNKKIFRCSIERYG